MSCLKLKVILHFLKIVTCLLLSRPLENEFNLYVNEILFSYERMSTQTRFEEEARANSEMAYCTFSWISLIVL